MEPGVTQENPPGTQPAVPAGWQHPRTSFDPIVLVGGILVFVGYLLFSVAQLSLLQFPMGTASIFFGVGEIMIATGFLLAFVGLSRRG